MFISKTMYMCIVSETSLNEIDVFLEKNGAKLKHKLCHTA